MTDITSDVHALYIQRLFGGIRRNNSDEFDYDAYEQDIIKKYKNAFAYLVPYIQKLTFRSVKQHSLSTMDDIEKAQYETYLFELAYLINMIKTQYKLPDVDYQTSLSDDGYMYWSARVWLFLHITSFLIQDGLHKKLFTFALDFPKIVCKIENLLPCYECYEHYLELKGNVKQMYELQCVIYKLAWGLEVRGVYDFHKLITRNVLEHQEQDLQQIDIEHSIYLPLDFMIEYKCAPYHKNVGDYVTPDKQGLYILRPEHACAISYITILTRNYHAFYDYYNYLKVIPTDILHSFNVDIMKTISNQMSVDDPSYDYFARINKYVTGNYNYDKKTFFDTVLEAYDEFEREVLQIKVPASPNGRIKKKIKYTDEQQQQQQPQIPLKEHQDDPALKHIQNLDELKKQFNMEFNGTSVPNI